MRHGHSLMGCHWHIQYLTQNLLLRSACSRHCSGPPKHRHCLPETFLPKMFFSKRSVSLIWINIYSQQKTNMWDAFQGCDSGTQNYVAFTWISSHSNVNKGGLHYKPGYEKQNIITLLWMCYVGKWQKNDWNKMAWMILWWCGGDWEDLGKWTSRELSTSGDCSVLSIQRASRDFVYYWDYVFGTGSFEVSVVLFCACFLKKMLNLRRFSACLFSCNPSITEQKNLLLLENWVYFVPIF